MPMAYLLSIYLLWRLQRISFDLFFAMLGIGFFLVLLLSPASPGWFLWVIPLLVYYQKETKHTEYSLIGLFSVLYIITSLLRLPQPLILEYNFVNDTVLKLNTTSLGTHSIGLLYTLLLTIGIILVSRIWQQTIQKNDYYRLSRRPLVIGIAGDSGSGKDTLADSLIGLFGTHSVTKISGDDYHLWD